MKEFLMRFLRLGRNIPSKKTKKLKETETRTYLIKKLRESTHKKKSDQEDQG